MTGINPSHEVDEYRLLAEKAAALEAKLAQREVEFAELQQEYQALQQKHGEFSTILDRIADGIFAVDAAWNFTYLNRETIYLLGRSKEELLGKNLWTEFPQALGTDFEKYALEAMAQQQSMRFECQGALHFRWYEVTLYPSANGLSFYGRDITVRKQVEDTLRESEERFRVALSNSHTFVGTTDRNLRYTWVYNPPKEFDSAAMLGKRDDELLSPDSAADIMALKQQVLEQEQGIRRELPIVFGGQTFCFDFTIEPLRNVTGEVIGLTFAATEITEQIKLRRQSEQAYAILDALFKSTPVGLALLGKDLRFVRVNPAMAKLNGISAEDHVGKTLPELLPNMGRSEQVQAMWENILETGVPIVGMEVTDSTPATGDQKHTWSATWYPIHLNGEIIGLGEVVEDITERRQAQDALRISQRNYRALAANLPGGAAFLVDKDLHYLVAEGQALAAIGMSPADFEGKTIWEVLDPEWAQHISHFYRGALNGEQFQEEHNNSGRYYISRGVPLRNEHGEIYAVLVVSYDITERKQIEFELQEMTAALEARVQERTEQVRNLASEITLAEQVERKRIADILHDHIQQILYGMQLEMHMLSQDLPAPRTNVVDERLAKLTEIINSALHAARTLAVELSPPVLENGGIVEAIHWLAGHMQEMHGLAVAITSEEGCRVPNRNQRMLLFQILRELLFNVVKHAGVNHASIHLQSNDHTFTGVVSDEGRGFIINSYKASGTAPTGFGLIGFIERLNLVGGTVLVQSAPGQGTHITISLPLLRAS